MIDFIQTFKDYCIEIGAEYAEGVCDMGTQDGKGTMKVVPGGGYRASLLSKGVEVAYGFSPINESEGLTDETKEGAWRSLLYNLMHIPIFNRAKTIATEE